MEFASVAKSTRNSKTKFNCVLDLDIYFTVEQVEVESVKDESLKPRGSSAGSPLEGMSVDSGEQ